MRSDRSIRKVTAALALAVTLLAGCTAGAASDDGIATAGGANGTGAASPSPSASKNPRDAMVDFAKCMRANGVDMPDPSEDGPIKIGPEDGQGQSQATVEKARRACEKHLPEIGGDAGRGPDPKMQDQMLKFAKCMREHGVDMPDPEFKGGGGSFRITGDPQTEEFKAAQEACKQYFGPPEGGGVSAGGS